MAYAKEVSQALVIRRISFNRTAETQRRLSEFVEQVEGNDYSIFGILRGKDKVVDNAEFSVASPPKEKKFFCSELAAACHGSMSVPSCRGVHIDGTGVKLLLAGEFC